MKTGTATLNSAELTQLRRLANSHVRDRADQQPRQGTPGDGWSTPRRMAPTRRIERR